MIIEYDNFLLDKFEFENGEILENANVEYIAKGTPKYDENGNIKNTLIFCHGYEGKYTSINEYEQLTSEGKPLDFNDYYIISISSLGFADSCCPSTTGLKQNFPKYNFKDKINFKKQFLKEKFNIEKVLGILGVGMGGYEVYTWACEYPYDMDFIIIGNSSYKTNGYRYAVSKGIKSIIESNEDYYSDSYTESLTKTMFSIYNILFSQFFSNKIFQKMSNEEIDIIMEEYIEKSYFVDIYDFKYQYDAIIDFNLEDKLSNIKAKTLILGLKNDLYFSSQYDVLPLENMIENCQIVLSDVTRDENKEIDYTNTIDILNKFLKEYK